MKRQMSLSKICIQMPRVYLSFVFCRLIINTRTTFSMVLRLLILSFYLLSQLLWLFFGINSVVFTQIRQNLTFWISFKILKLNLLEFFKIKKCPRYGQKSENWGVTEPFSWYHPVEKRKKIANFRGGIGKK